jgi:hypothetical protein
MRIYPNNEDCPLNHDEMARLGDVLDNIEWNALRPFKHLTSAYVEAEVDGYDEFEIEGTVTWGVDGQWSDFDFFTIDREKMMEEIKDGKSKD